MGPPVPITARMNSTPQNARRKDNICDALVSDTLRYTTACKRNTLMASNIDTRKAGSGVWSAPSLFLAQEEPQHEVIL
eukprot:1186376-Prorocentrum_minimum.AAC.6